jgi:hypothetical protein
MRIAQIVLPNASAYERKSQSIDAAGLAAQHEVTLYTDPHLAAARGADIAHVYASDELPTAAFRGFPIPYVSSVDLPASRWPFRRPTRPALVTSPLFEKTAEGRQSALPEAVDGAYFEQREHPVRSGSLFTIGSFARSTTRNAVEQTEARLQRFRNDVQWIELAHPPGPADLTRVDVWVDPAVRADDFDGFTAEALVSGLPVVASRTPLNERRLERGRTGFLVPPGDPNELAHAILAALFKPEVAEGKKVAARQTTAKFRSVQRLRVLIHLYETLTA